MIRVVHPWSRIRMLTFSHPGSRGQKGTQSRIRNTGFFHILLKCWWVTVYIHIMVFYLMFTLKIWYCCNCFIIAYVNDTDDTVVVTGDKLIASVMESMKIREKAWSPVSLTLVNILSPVSMIPAIHTKLGISPWVFDSKFEMEPTEYSGDRGKLIIFRKNWSRNSRVRHPLNKRLLSNTF
jgi:hypothetical protein